MEGGSSLEDRQEGEEKVSSHATILSLPSSSSNSGHGVESRPNERVLLEDQDRRRASRNAAEGSSCPKGRNEDDRRKRERKNELVLTARVSSSSESIEDVI